MYSKINDKYKTFISNQKIFFVSTAPKEGRINLSPKGLDTFRIITANKVAWLNFTGSGNETATHLLEDDRMTIMFCAFEGDPAIIRLYGHAQIIHEENKEWNDYLSLFPGFAKKEAGARQIMVMNVHSLQKSCGYSVPLFDYQGQRGTLIDWNKKMGKDGIETYWKERNALSIDGKKTDLG